MFVACLAAIVAFSGPDRTLALLAKSISNNNNDGVFRRHDSRCVWRQPHGTRIETRGG